MARPSHEQSDKSLPSPCIFQNFSNIGEGVVTEFANYLELQRLSNSNI
jgi:hypothetical protein